MNIGISPRDSPVVSVLDMGSEGPRFEPVGRGWSRIKRGPVARAPWAGRHMSTGYGWEGLRQVCATLLGARHVPAERLCGGLVYLGRYNKCSRLPFLLL